MAHRASEQDKIYTEVGTITSAANFVTKKYDMGDAYKITFIVSAGTAAASTAYAPTFSVSQSPDEAGATSTAVAGATATLLGPTTAFRIDGAGVGLITMSTASTTTEVLSIVVGGATYDLTYVAQSTLVSTVATSLAFGSSLGSSNAGGLEAVMNTLSSVINNSTLSKWLVASTPSTLAVRIDVSDSAISTTGVTVYSTGANLAPSYIGRQSIVEVLAEDMNSSSKYLFGTITTMATSLPCAITVIKSGVRQQPPTQLGQVVKST